MQVFRNSRLVPMVEDIQSVKAHGMRSEHPYSRNRYFVKVPHRRTWLTDVLLSDSAAFVLMSNYSYACIS